MSEFEFRVIEPVRYQRVASDPRESYRFLKQVASAPGATRVLDTANSAQPANATPESPSTQPTNQEVTHNV